MSLFQTISKTHIRDNRGDTIIEVLICVGILGAVLGAAYVTANRNSMINQASQERLSASKIAESQLERLRAKAALDPDLLFLQTELCLDSSNNIKGVADSACTVDQSGSPAPPTTYPSYQIKITRGTQVATLGYMYTIKISWDNVAGKGVDQLSYQYGVYR